MNKIYRIPTGDPVLDQITDGGPTAPFLGAIVGGPTSGKSQKLVDMLHEALKREIPTIFVSPAVLTRRIEPKISEYKKFFMVRTGWKGQSVEVNTKANVEAFKGHYGVDPRLLLVDAAEAIHEQEALTSLVTYLKNVSKDMNLVVWLTTQVRVPLGQKKLSDDIIDRVRLASTVDLLAKVSKYKEPAEVILYRAGFRP